jgi:DNA-binding transcriptional ArsR family regulator
MPAEHEARLAKAMSHPLRIRLLVELTKGVHSPKMVADLVGEPVENVAYHVKVLRDLGCIELVDTKQKRGATEHFYRAVTGAFVSNAPSADLPYETRAAMTTTVLQQAFIAAHEAIDARALDARTDRRLSLTRLSLTEDGWLEVNRLLDDVLERAVELHVAAVTAGEQDVTSELLLAHFPSAASATNAALRTP